jgi:amino acid transporter
MAGIVLPVILLIAVIVATGFSYRIGQTCFPNHENAIATFWIWLVAFAIAGFLLQTATTGYCVWVYMRTIRNANHEYQNSINTHRANQKAETWANVKRLVLLQWRNILVSIFTIVGSIAFFIVFWTEDHRLARIFQDSANIQLVQKWITCQKLSRGNKEECRKFVADFTVPQATVLTSLILASVSRTPIIYPSIRQQEC